jgi:hypothetical protein
MFYYRLEERVAIALENLGYKRGKDFYMPKKAMVIGQTEEYKEGWEAYGRQISKAENPYPEGTAGELAWRHGWESREASETEDEDAKE